MVSAVGSILNAAQKSQLISLQSVARLIEKVQLRLASGLDVNTAIDDPVNFFSARALDFRASDISRRLDGIGQSIRTIQETQSGVEASIQLVDQTEAYLQDILEKIEAGELEFQDVEGNGVPPNVTQILPTAGDFTSYAGAQDSGGPVLVANGGEDITLDGNLWKRLAVNYTVTADTVLEFEYSSTLIPEISAIGFDNDTNFGNDNDRFFMYGTQTGGITYSAPAATYQYGGGGGFESVSIPIGTFFTGAFTHMTFINDDDAGPAGNATFRNVILREGPVQASPDVTLAPPGVQEEFDNLLDQLDLLTLDANYRGINLLRDEKLETIFNENATSRLVTDGIDGTAEGLGIARLTLNSVDNINLAIDALKDARETLRDYTTTLAAQISIIQTREDFAQETINVLKAASDDLVVTDQNQAGAEFLALRTRQQIGVSALAFHQSSITDLI